MKTHAQAQINQIHQGTILEIEGNELGARRNGKGHGFLCTILLSKLLPISGDKPKNWVVEGNPERCRGRYPTEDSFVPKKEKIIYC